MKTVNYINLTNGIEFLPEVKDFRFLRIRSTHLERHLLADVLAGISDDLLMNLALGNRCVIYDFGMYFDKPRSIWEGIPWIKYALNRCWFNKEEDFFITRWRHRGKYIPNKIVLTEEKHPKNYKVFFRNRYDRMDPKLKEKLEYFKQYINCATINLYGISKKTEHDGDFEFYKKILFEGNKHEA